METISYSETETKSRRGQQPTLDAATERVHSSSTVAAFRYSAIVFYQATLIKNSFKWAAQPLSQPPLKKYDDLQMCHHHIKYRKYCETKTHNKKMRERNLDLDLHIKQQTWWFISSNEIYIEK